MKKGNIIYWIVILLWIFILIIIGIRKYNEYFNPVAEEAWLINPYFLVDRSGNQNHLTSPIQYKDSIAFDGVDDYLSLKDGYLETNDTMIMMGRDYNFMGDYKIQAYSNRTYSSGNINYFIWTTDILTLLKVIDLCNELEKRWGEKESIVIKPDSLENQLFKINE